MLSERCKMILKSNANAMTTQMLIYLAVHGELFRNKTL